MLRTTILTSWLMLALLPANAQTSATAITAPIDWMPFEDALKAASMSGRIMLVDVFAPSCPWCAKLQREVYTVDSIQTYLKANFEIARLNIEEAEDVIEFKGYKLNSAELAAGFGAEATPTTVFLDAKGTYITRLPGFVEAGEFIHILRYIGSGAYNVEPYKDFRERQD